MAEPVYGPAVCSTTVKTVLDEEADHETIAAIEAAQLEDVKEASMQTLDCFTTETDVAHAPLFVGDTSSGALTTGKDQHCVRTLWCAVNDQVTECILDGGSQIASISKQCCARLKIATDPKVGLQIRSANGSLNGVVGLARDVPVQITPTIVVLLQLFVIREASYDVLLGRPFEVLLKTMTENLGPNTQFITIRCPNTGETARLPTYARGEHSAPALSQIKGFRL